MSLPEHYNPIESEREFFEASEKDLPVFIKFFLLYASFNSQIARMSKKIYDYEMIRGVKQRNSPYRDKYNEIINSNDTFRNWIRELMHIKVVNVREIKKRENAIRLDKNYNQNKKTYHQLKSFQDFDTLIEIIYQVRCNLFHGAKDIENNMELGLIELCYNMLNALYVPFIES